MSNSKRTLTAEDLFRVVVVGDPQASPDGGSIAWVQSQADKEMDGYRSAIWVADADGTHARQLTSGRHRDGNPRWSPDGRTIAFVSNRPGLSPASAGTEDAASDSAAKPARKDEKESKPLPQIWTIAIDGGEAVQRTTHPNGADAPAWSPDGERIAFVAKDDPTEEERSAAPSFIGPVADERVVQSVSYRFDGQGFLEKFSHIWVANLSDGSSTQITTGPANDGSPAWSPDGEEIAFTSNRTADRALRWNRQVVYVTPASGGSVRQLTPDDGRLGSPAWSPDGSRLALIGHAGTGSYLIDRIWMVDADGTNLACLTESTDMGFGDSGMGDVALGGENGPVWAGEETVLALASHSGETQVLEVSIEDGDVQALTAGKHRINGFAPVQGGLVVSQGAIDRPFELAFVKQGDETPVAITAANSDFLNDVQLSPAIDLAIDSADGTPIQGWIIPPAGADLESGARHPLIVQIHGGPHAMYGYALFHEMQLMAAKGYAVAFCNPRGSAGYGQEFHSCTRGVWGEADMPDVIALAEHAASLPWIDEDRHGITGGSYGGYLTNWIVSHNDRFRAAVTQRCVSSFLSFFGTSDIGTTFGVDEFGGVPWSDFEQLRKYSPVSYVDRITTPLLILHSEKDLRCPIEQAEQMYAALFYLGRDVGFVRFPDESHELSRSGTPSRRLARLHHLTGWFDQKL